MAKKRTVGKKATSSETRLLFTQLKQIAQGLGETFAPFCEVVVHDLTDPKNAIFAIHNNLSGRKVGQPATELGLARIADPEYPQVVANYQNTFPDGRAAKSTSIGIKNEDGIYVAALCMNIDLTLFQGLQNAIGQFSSINPEHAPQETLTGAGAEGIRAKIDEFAAQRATTPRSLKTDQRRDLLQELKDGGYLEVRRSADIIASHLGVSRATVYSDAR